MNQLSKHLLFFLASLSLVGCRQNLASENSSSCNSVVPPLNLESTSVQENPSISSRVVETILWDENVDSLLQVSLGKFINRLPVLTADEYIANNTHNDKYDLEITTIYCFSSDAATLAKVYKSALSMDHFPVEKDSETGYFSGFKRVAIDSLLCLSYGSFKQEDKQGVVLSTWIQHDKEKEFPQDDVYDFIYDEVPVPQARYYSHAIRQTAYTTMLEIDCYDIDRSAYHQYATTLEEEGYDIQDYGDAYSAIDPTKYFGIQFSYYSAEESIEVGFEGDMSVMVMLIYLMK